MGKSRAGALVFVAVCILAAAGPIPAPWTETDIGAPGQAGSSTYDPVSDAWTVNGGGGDIWDTADHFHFVSRTLSGNCELTARVMTQGNTNAWAKAGVMIRETTAAGSTFAMSAITPGNGANVQWRTATDGSASASGGGVAATVPVYVRINRTGDVFTGYFSTDGATWTQNGQVTITMAASVQVGLAVTSHDDAQRSDCTFENFLVTDGTGGIVWPLAPPTNLSATDGVNSVTLNWTASTSAATTGYTVLRGTTSGGPYTALAGGTTSGTTYTDTTATNPNTYYYVVIATGTVGQSGYSNQATGNPLPSPVTALPNTGLFTNENGTTALFTLHFNSAAPAGGSLVTVLSGNSAEGTVSESMFAYTSAGGGTGIQFTVPAGFTGDIPITITGVNDSLVDGSVAYAISITASNMGVTIPDVQCTNNDNDTPGITFSRTSGLLTNESGLADGFTVALNTKPFGVITMSLASSNPAEALVSPTTITFDSANWSTPQPVVVTGVDDPALDFTQPFTIVSGALVPANASDSAYAAVPTPDVTGLNLDNETIPSLPHVWGGSEGSGGGCGLLGLELGLVLAFAALRRRRNY